MELLAKNESMNAEHARTKDNLLQQIKMLTIDNERLQTSLALSQARVLSARPASATQAQSAPATQEEGKEEEEKEAEKVPAQENGTAESAYSGRLTRSQSQQTRTQERTQEQHTREILLNKTRSRPSYIPKPASRKETVTLHVRETKENTQNNNKENTQNNKNSSASVEEAPQVRKTRASMIPIRKGSSLVAPSVKALRS
jgi:hypothetical protein